MLETVEVGRRTLDAYRGLAPDPLLDDLAIRAERLRGARILHVNATPYGGGVSELLRAVVPLQRSLGLVADWRIIRGDERFFQVTKTVHNGLQGAAVELSEVQKAVYLENTKENAQAFLEQYDFVFVHDPQPAAILSMRGKGSARWIWRCHIDTSQPNPPIWAFLRPFLGDYDAAIFTMAEFALQDMPIRKIEIIPPAIDPLSPKNLPLPRDTAKQVLDWLGVRDDQRLLTQVSRFDPWKDPLGVIEVFRKIRDEVPDLQLVLAGSLALDDPEGWEIYRAIRAQASGDPSIHVFTNLIGVGNIEVNALQMLSDVVLQKSIREGFGLVVSETLWKGTPVVAGRAGGIPLQMADGVGGILVDSIDECSAAVCALLADRERARTLAEAGRERVREHFLIPRLVLNELELMGDLASERPLIREADWFRKHDPVCGMALHDPPEAKARYREVEYGFCSTRCRSEFLESPDRYAPVISDNARPNA